MSTTVDHLAFAIGECIAQKQELREMNGCLVKTNAGHMDELQKAFDQVKELARANIALRELNAEMLALRDRVVVLEDAEARRLLRAVAEVKAKAEKLK